MTDSGESELGIFRSLMEEESNFLHLSNDQVSNPGCKDPGNFREKTTQRSDGKVYEYLSRNIYFCYVQLEKDIEKSIRVNSYRGFIQSNFCLRGKNSFYFGQEEKPFFEIADQQHNILYPGNRTIKLIPDKSKKLEALAIHIRTSFFIEYLVPKIPSLKRFYNHILKENTSILYDQNLSIDTKIGLSLKQLLFHRPKGSLRNQYIEAKVMELLVWQMGAMEEEEQHANLLLKEEEIRKMREVRFMLTSQLNEKLTLKSLAHRVGTNEFNLKKNFKIVFGQTVFGFQHQYKMEMAKSLLAQKEYKIADIAEKLGYKYPTHFTAAFKKHFGYLPHESWEKGEEYKT